MGTLKPKMQPERVAQRYAQDMKHHSLGHACYYRTSSGDVGPSTVGYFDHKGRWKSIISLHDLQPSSTIPAQAIASKFTRLIQDLEPETNSESYWGTLVSTHTMRTDDGFILDACVTLTDQLFFELAMLMKYFADQSKLPATMPP